MSGRGLAQGIPNDVTVKSSYFAPRDLRLEADEIVVIACGRNEGHRLPSFLDYYRRLGVDRFLFVDNASSDGTRELLEHQPDVEYFMTTTSYRGSSSVRDHCSCCASSVSR